MKKKAVKTVGLNEAFNLINSEREKDSFLKSSRDRQEKISENLGRVNTYLRIFEGYLASEADSSGMDIDDIYPFLPDLREMIDETEKEFHEFTNGLWETGRKGSHTDKENKFLFKAHTSVEKIPIVPKPEDF